MNAEIETALELLEAIRDVKTGGYEVDINVKPIMKRFRAGDGTFFLVVDVRSTWPGFLDGEYWFESDGTVMQVL